MSRRPALWIGAARFTILLIRTAWCAEDAFISFRVIYLIATSTLDTLTAVTIAAGLIVGFALREWQLLRNSDSPRAAQNANGRFIAVAKHIIRGNLWDPTRCREILAMNTPRRANYTAVFHNCHHASR